MRFQMSPELSIPYHLSQNSIGKLFLGRAYAAAKLLLPKLLRVRATASVLLDDERRERRVV